MGEKRAINPIRTVEKNIRDDVILKQCQRDDRLTLSVLFNVNCLCDFVVLIDMFTKLYPQMASQWFVNCQSFR